jgi:DNA polymerase-3 subunit alpha
MRSISKPEDLLEAAYKIGAPAVGITDYCSLAGIWEAINHKLAKKVKVIVGCELNFTHDRNPVFNFINGVDKTKPNINKKRIVLIAKNQIGYHNLLMLNYEAEKCKLEKLSKIDKVSLIDLELLKKYKDGIICLTGGNTGVVNKNLTDGYFEYAKKEAIILKDIFKDDFYFELQPNYLIFDGAEQFAVNRGLFKLSKELIRG